MALNCRVSAVVGLGKLLITTVQVNSYIVLYRVRYEYSTGIVRWDINTKF